VYSEGVAADWESAQLQDEGILFGRSSAAVASPPSSQLSFPPPFSRKINSDVSTGKAGYFFLVLECWTPPRHRRRKKATRKRGWGAKSDH